MNIINEFTLNEVNFLRWLIVNKFTVLMKGDVAVNIMGDVDLSPYQSELLASIQRKLIAESSH